MGHKAATETGLFLSIGTTLHLTPSIFHPLHSRIRTCRDGHPHANPDAVAVAANRMVAVVRVERDGSVVVRDLANGRLSTIAAPRSITTARNSPPSSVWMQVMSPAQTPSGAATLNCRSSRLGAIGRSWLLSVVAVRDELEAALAFGLYAMQLHELLDPFFAHPDYLLPAVPSMYWVSRSHRGSRRGWP